MQYVYFDASALIKRYSSESGTPLLNEVFSQLPASQMVCSTIGILEIVSILVRKQNDGRLLRPLFDQAMTEFRAEVIDNEQFLSTSITDTLLYSALELIAKYSLNATDAIVLRSAIDLRQTIVRAGSDLILWTADKRLARAAQTEGVSVFDPETETIGNLHTLLGI